MTESKPVRPDEGKRDLIDFVSRQRQNDIAPELREAILKRVMALAVTPSSSDSGETSDPLIGLDERLDQLFVSAAAPDNTRFILSTNSARNIVGIVREWIRSHTAPPKPAPDEVRGATINRVSKRLAQMADNIGGMHAPELERLSRALAASVLPADGAPLQEYANLIRREAKWIIEAVATKEDSLSLEDVDTEELMNAANFLDRYCHNGNASPPATGAAEPVAWRWRNPDDKSGTWRYVEKEMHEHPSLSLKVEPLYATPPELLNERDDFIVRKGLWSEFTDGLSRQPQQSSREG